MDMTIVGAFAVTWVAAILIALRDPTGNRGLICAVTVGAAILFLGALYEKIMINPFGTSPITWATLVVLLFVALSLAAAYPRR